MQPITDQNIHDLVQEYVNGNPHQYPPIGNWDVSNVTNMSSLFREHTFNEDISTWDVSNVTNMSNMFKKTIAFNQPLNEWNVSNVKNMSGMFMDVYTFNQPLNSWDVSKVTNMSGMFHNNSSFNQPLDAWNVSNVNNMRGMFSYAMRFNQPLGAWDVSNVNSMCFMFGEASLFNQPLDAWNVSNVTNMDQMFYDAKAFNESLHAWNVHNVRTMRSMFDGAELFNQPLDAWDVSNVQYMDSMFANTDFNQPLNTWNVNYVKTMEKMFAGTSYFNQPLDAWNVSNVTNMRAMFFNTTQFNQPLHTWDVSHVTNMSMMFCNTDSFNQPLNTWDVSHVQDMSLMFDHAAVFNQPLTHWNVSNVTNMTQMFMDSAFNHPLNTWSIRVDANTTNFGRPLPERIETLQDVPASVTRPSYIYNRRTNIPSMEIPEAEGLVFDVQETAYDAISMEEYPIGEYLRQSTDHLGFKVDGHYYLTSKSAIFTQLKNEANLKYGCRTAGDQMIYYDDNNVINEPLYFSMSAILSLQIVVTVGQLATILRGNYNGQPFDARTFVLVDTSQRLPSIMSRRFRYNLDREYNVGISADHCQPGKEMAVYQIQMIQPSEEIVQAPQLPTPAESEGELDLVMQPETTSNIGELKIVVPNVGVTYTFQVSLDISMGELKQRLFNKLVEENIIHIDDPQKVFFLFGGKKYSDEDDVKQLSAIPGLSFGSVLQVYGIKKRALGTGGKRGVRHTVKQNRRRYTQQRHRRTMKRRRRTVRKQNRRRKTYHRH